MQKHFLYYVALIVIVGAFYLTACGSAGNATPTSIPVDIDALSTAAVQTFIAQLTQQAPTLTPTPLFTNTPLSTATSTLPAPTLVPPTATGCANATFNSDITIPDGTQMSEGQTFTKTWSVQNSGTCTWTTAFKLVFSYGESMGGQTVYMQSSVAAGMNVNISVNLTVPNKTGKLTGVWKLEDDKGQPFGPFLTVVIVAGTPSPTPTGPTATPTETQTPKPTITPTP